MIGHTLGPPSHLELVIWEVRQRWRKGSHLLEVPPIVVNKCQDWVSVFAWVFEPHPPYRYPPLTPKDEKPRSRVMPRSLL